MCLTGCALHAKKNRQSDAYLSNFQNYNPDKTISHQA